MWALLRVLHQALPVKERRGSAILETALALMVLMLLMMGIFDLGRVVYALNDITQVSREIAHSISLNSTDQAGAIAAGLARSTLVDLGSDGVLFTPLTDSPGADVPVHSMLVTVTYRFHAINPVISEITGPDGIELVVRSKALLE